MKKEKEKKEKREFISLGIDVASEKLDVFLREKEEVNEEEKREKRNGKKKAKGIDKTFANNFQGISRLISFLKGKDFKGRIVMESTGRYHSLSAVLLQEANFKVFVINPLIVKKYRTSQIRKTKTDRIDARLLSLAALIEKNLLLFESSREDLVLRQKISLLNCLEKSIQRLKASFLNYESSVLSLERETTEVEEELKKTIKKLGKNKGKLEKEIAEIISQKKGNQNKIEILRSIPGVSEFLASLILFFYKENIGHKSSQWIAYSGMEITVSESGKFKGKGKISKRGNRYLRKRQFSGAWGAYMHSEEFKNYYQELKEKGRTHREALNILARKIIRISFSLLKHNKRFDAAKCF